MCVENFNNFRLLFCLICTDCEHVEDFHLLLGDLFNIECDLILFDVDLINLSHKTCQSCKNFIYLDLRKLFRAEQIRRLYDGICRVKKRKLKIKNVIPKDKDTPRAFGKILLRKDPEFDVLCFDINIDGFHPARIRLWLQNHTTNPPSLIYLLRLALPVVVVIFNETFFSLLIKKWFK